MSGLSRRKGVAFERAIARELTEWTGEAHKRVLVESRDGNSGDVKSRMPFTYQCKCGARPNVFAAVKEAEHAAGSDFAVAVVHRTGRGGERIVALPWSDWLELVARMAREGW